MNRKRYTVTVTASALLMGLAAGLTINTNIIENNFSNEEHEHALLFIEVNGTQVDLTKDKYQLQSSEVHLENNRSNIVHKHRDGVQWKEFFQTINIDINHTEEESCLKLDQKRQCGNMTVLLNGQEYNREKEIDQGDKLAIVIGENNKRRAEAFMEFKIPQQFRKPDLTTKV